MSAKLDNESFHEEGSQYLGFQPDEGSNTRGNKGRGNRPGRDYNYKQTQPQQEQESSWLNNESQKEDEVAKKEDDGDDWGVESDNVGNKSKNANSSWLGDNQENKEQAKPSRSRRNGPTNEQKQEEGQQKNQPQQNLSSSWLDTSQTQEKQAGRRKNNQTQEIPADDTPNQNNTSWLSGDNETKTVNTGNNTGGRGGRNNHAENNSDSNPGRGNRRGNRGTDDQKNRNREYANNNNFNNNQYNNNNGQYGDFKKKNYGGDYQRGDNNTRGGGRGGYRGNRDNRDNRDNKDNNYGNNDGQRNYRNNREGGYANQQRNFRNNDFDRRKRTEDQHNTSESDISMKQKKEEQTTKQQIVKIEPHGQKCWPETSIFIRSTKISFTYKKITEHVADVLIIPYRDLTFNVYPGSIVNSFQEVDYRKQIADKGADLQKVGSVCFQKCVQLDNFKALGFMKIGEQSQIEKCFIDFFGSLRKLKSKFKSVLIPYSKDLGPSQTFFKTILTKVCTSTDKSLQKIFLSTDKGDDFVAGFKAFSDEIIRMTSYNEISIKQ